jgi:hypothetical protein
MLGWKSTEYLGWTRQGFSPSLHGENMNCCICNPTIKLNPHVCKAHKAEARQLAKTEMIFVSAALGELYLTAKESL